MVHRIEHKSIKSVDELMARLKKMFKKKKAVEGEVTPQEMAEAEQSAQEMAKELMRL